MKTAVHAGLLVITLCILLFWGTLDAIPVCTGVNLGAHIQETELNDQPYRNAELTPQLQTADTPVPPSLPSIALAQLLQHLGCF